SGWVAAGGWLCGGVGGRADGGRVCRRWLVVGVFVDGGGVVGKAAENRDVPAVLSDWRILFRMLFEQDRECPATVASGERRNAAFPLLPVPPELPTELDFGMLGFSFLRETKL